MAVRHVLIQLIVGSALAVGLAAPAGAAGDECRVRNVTDGTAAASDLGSAIADADPGDRLRVNGTCRGNFEIDKDLVIVGGPGAVLDAYGAGTTVTVLPTATVRLARLTITRSSDSGLDVSEGATVKAIEMTWMGNDSDRVGGAITNGGGLQLRRSTVTGNAAELDGGGIFNFGELTLIHTDLSHNEATGTGGGLFNEGVAVLRHSTVTHNVAASSGGILNVSLITLIDTVVADNVPNDCDGC